MKSTLFLLFFIIGGLVWAQDNYFSSPTPILENDLTGIGNPRMVIRSNGQPLIMFSNGGDYIKLIGRNNDGSFTEVANFDANVLAGTTYGPDIKNFNDTVYVSYGILGGDIYVLKSTDDGETWSDPIHTLSITDAHFEYSKLAINKDGQPRVNTIASGGPFSTYQQIVIYSNDGGSTWDYTSVHQDVDNDVPCECCQGDVVTNDNFETVLFRGNNNNVRDIVVSRSSDASNSFPDNELIDRSNWGIMSCPVTGPEGYINSQDKLTATWMSKGNGKTRVLVGQMDLNIMETDTNFFIDTDISDNVNQNFPSIAGNEDIMGIVWEDNRFTFKHIFFSYTTSGIDGFGESFVVSDTSISGFNQSPQIVIDDNDLFHVVWKKGNNIMYCQASVLSSVNTIKQENELYLFPNPATNHVELNLIGDKVELYNSNGQLLSTDWNSNRVDLDQFPHGMYFIRVYLDDKIHLKKVVKQ